MSVEFTILATGLDEPGVSTDRIEQWIERGWRVQAIQWGNLPGQVLAVAFERITPDDRVWLTDVIPE